MISSEKKSLSQLRVTSLKRVAAMRVAIFTALPICYDRARLFACVCAHFVLNLLLFVEVSVILPYTSLFTIY